MPIVLALVAYQKVLLVEDRISVSARPTVNRLIENLPRHDHKASYESNKTVFHCLVENEFVYICASENEHTSRQVYGYLDDIKSKFKEQFAGGRYPKPSELNPRICAKFSTVLSAQMRQWNDNPESDKMGKLKAQIDDVKQVMLQNIDDLIQRGEHIDNLVSTTGNLEHEALKFHHNANTLKNAMIMRNIKIMIAIFLALVVLGLIIAFVACGITFEKCKPTEVPTAAPSSTIAPSWTSTAAPTAPVTTINATMLKHFVASALK